MDWSPEDLGSLLDSMREGIQVISPDGRYLYLNHAAAAHGRTTVDALVGRRMVDCYPGIDATEMYQILRRSMDARTPERMLSEFHFADGQVRWFELRFHPCAQGLLILSIDVTDQHRLEEELHRARRFEALGRLAAGVTHDFNNLLTVFSASATFIEDTVPVGSPVRADTAQIHEAAARGARLTRQLLDFLRARPSRAGCAEPASVIPRVVELLRRLLGDGVQVVARVADGLPAAAIATGALEQVLMNLLLNARDALGGRGVVEVEAFHLATAPDPLGLPATPGGWVVISVTDTGSGIAPEVLQHLFEPFVTTKSTRGGTGLGLASCRGIVDQAGGHIDVQTVVDHGSTFTVYLPTAAPTGAEVRSEAPTTRRDGTEAVLVVEADVAVRALTVRALSRFGYRVHGSGSVREARMLLDRHPYQLLLTELRLPDGTGPDLARVAAEAHGVRRVLFLSTSGDRSLVELVPPELMVEKPFEPDQIVERVRRRLDAGRALPAA